MLPTMRSRFSAAWRSRKSCDARRAIEAEGCRVEELTPAEHELFARAVAPMMAEAGEVYGARDVKAGRPVAAC